MGANLVSRLSQNGSNTRTGSRVNSSDTQVRMGISILRENGQGSISVYFLYLLLMMPRPYIGCSGFQSLWVVNATEVTPLPSNGALMGSNGLTVWFGNCLECLLILNDPVSLSGMVDPFTRHCTIVNVTSSGMLVCSSVLSIAPQLLRSS